MQVVKNELDGNTLVVGFKEDDFVVYSSIPNDVNKTKDELLQQAYIQCRSAIEYEKTRTEHSLKCEIVGIDFIPDTPKATTLIVDFKKLKGEVLDQYGELYSTEVKFSIEGTDKAVIKDGMLEEQIVDVDTDYFVVAKYGDLFEKQKRSIIATIPTTLIVDFDKLKGKVLDQYGKLYSTQIKFSIEGTDKAVIIDGTLEEQVVDGDTEYYIVAKYGDLFEKQKRTIFAPIVPHIPTVEELRRDALYRIYGMCSGAIYTGLDIGDKHYSFSRLAQTDIAGCMQELRNGASVVPYKADGEKKYSPYNLEQMTPIYNAMSEWIKVNTQYKATLEEWIAREGSKDVLNSIDYGIMLPNDLLQELGTQLAVYGVDINKYAAMLGGGAE